MIYRKSRAFSGYSSFLSQVVLTGCVGISRQIRWLPEGPLQKAFYLITLSCVLRNLAYSSQLQLALPLTPPSSPLPLFPYPPLSPIPPPPYSQRQNSIDKKMMCVYGNTSPFCMFDVFNHNNLFTTSKTFTCEKKTKMLSRYKLSPKEKQNKSSSLMIIIVSIVSIVIACAFHLLACERALYWGGPTTSR